MSDQRQIRRLFEQCIEQHADSLYRVALRLMGNRDLADELIQETYLNAWRGLESLKDETKMRGWLFAILRNQYTKILRSTSKTTQLPTTIPIEEVALARSEDAVQVEQQYRVQTAIDRLPDSQKIPTLLIVMEGLSVEEAAAVLSIPRGTVLSRLHRGRAKLKRWLTVDE